MSKNILIIVTSHDLIDADHKTGIWFEEFAVPYTLFLDEGYSVTVVSPEGGDAPVDAGSMLDYQASNENERAMAALKNLPALSDAYQTEQFDAVFFPGGHGTMYDLPDNPYVQRIIEDAMQTNKPLAAVCHGPACLVNVKNKDDASLVRGRNVTAFTNSEEQAVQLDTLMPFLLEERFRACGANFISAENWADNCIVDGNLVTGQNPQSSASAANAVIALLKDT